MAVADWFAQLKLLYVSLWHVCRKLQGYSCCSILYVTLHICKLYKVSLTSLHDQVGCAESVKLRMQFPDPHWKLRNRKKRIVQPQLVAAVAQLIAPGGQVFLQSDVQEVHLWAQSAVDTHAPSPCSCHGSLRHGSDHGKEHLVCIPHKGKREA